MNVVNSNNIINSNEKYLTNSKLINKEQNIYSKIAPPNTFKKRNPNQILRGSKVLKRNEKSPDSYRIINPYINKTNLIKNNSISKSHIILNEFKINSSYRDKNKLIKGNNNILINNNMNNSHNFIITPKKILFAKIKVKGNKIDFNKYKSENQNISNKKENIEIKKNNFITKSIKKEINIENINIKEKYDLLIQRTKILLSNYQNIIDYYQEKEKLENNNNK